MKKGNKWVLNSTDLNILTPTSIVNEKVRFSYPQSSLLILGNYNRPKNIYSAFINFKHQFQYWIYILSDHLAFEIEGSLFDSNCLLHTLNAKSILNGSTNSDIIYELFKENRCLAISLKGISPRSWEKYWNLLSLNIRMFILKKKVPMIPYLMVWIDKSLTSLDPMIFEHFRILGLWGEEYGLRFCLSLGRYSYLSYPARTLFGAYALLPGIPNEEIVEIITHLPLSKITQRQLFEQYQKLDLNYILLVSPNGMFDPMLVKIF